MRVVLFNTEWGLESHACSGRAEMSNLLDGSYVLLSHTCAFSVPETLDCATNFTIYGVVDVGIDGEIRDTCVVCVCIFFD